MGAYTLLQDLTVATNSTSVVLNDFGTITKDDFIKVVCTLINSNTTTQNSISMFVNSETTSSNYTRQFLFANGSSTVALRGDVNQIDAPLPGQTSSTLGYIKISENDRFNWFCNNTLRNNNEIINQFLYMTSSGATFSSGITTLTFTGDQTNGIGTGSRIQIYKLAAVKVADFVTTSNSTQVDIPFPTGTFSPAIDKDSEYLLTWTIESSVTAFVTHNLTPNDLTTLTGYHRQEIAGNGSSASAGRANHARIAETSTDRPFSTGYAHIKLSNIGAYTVQAYDLLGSGTNEPVLANGFISSTAENITSITKLNVIANSTNAIAAGSRFTLYKLYE